MYLHRKSDRVTATYSKQMEDAISRCIAEVLEDEPKDKGWFAHYLWHRRWRKTEYYLFLHGGMFSAVNWVVCREALNRIGGF